MEGTRIKFKKNGRRIIDAGRRFTKRFRGLALILVIGLLGSLNALADGNSYSTVPLRSFGELAEVVGSSSTLKRTEDGLEFTLQSFGLQEIHPVGPFRYPVRTYVAYSIWWVIFNNPEFCTHPQADSEGTIIGNCGAGDFNNPQVNASSLWATGMLVDLYGVGKAVALLGQGLENAPGQVLFGPGLTNPAQAEVHIIIRSHGRASFEPNELGRQLSTLGEGCNPSCRNVHAAIHRLQGETDD